MMTEIRHPRQIAGEPFRRWFTDEYFDLVIWESPGKKILAFQLCYNKGPEEKALTWKKDTGFVHTGVDNGEGHEGHYKMTPILVSDGIFDRDAVVERFTSESIEIPAEARTFVLKQLREYQY